MIDLDAEIAKLNHANADRDYGTFGPDASPDDYPFGPEIEPPGTPTITATPFAWPDPTCIPPRQWLFGRWLLRGEVTAVIAPGGVGKSTLIGGVALSLASGREFLGKTVWEGARTVWVWNLEDDREEMERSLTACALHHGIGEAECGGRLYVDSGLEQRLCTAIEGADGFKIIEPVYESLRKEIEARGIDVLTVDPFVSSHEVDENSNSLIDAIGKRWKRLASETGCSIVLVHHTKKMGGQEVKAESSRGAVALINVARSTLVINSMSKDEADRFGITDRQEQRSIVRVDDDKPNRAPPESAWWMKKASVELGNSDQFNRTDDVGAAVHWTPPDPFENLSTRDLYNVQVAIQAADDEQCRANVQADGWVGKVAGTALHLNTSEAAVMARVKALVKTWIATGALTVDRRPDPKGKGKTVPYVMVGNWVDPACLPALKSGVGQGGESGGATP
jgi:hypothetical protein